MSLRRPAGGLVRCRDDEEGGPGGATDVQFSQTRGKVEHVS